MTVRLTGASFDPGALLSEFSRGRTETGAVATFTGLARAEQGATNVLELEAYPGFTEAEIGRIGDEAGAVEAARKMVGDSPHHLGAELRLDGRRLIGFGTLAANDEAAE